MLVLSRKQEQTVLVGDQIEVKILKIRGNMVRIGISAPQDVKIMRGEIAPFGLESVSGSKAEDREMTLEVEFVAEELDRSDRVTEASTAKKEFKRQHSEPLVEDLPLPNPFAVAQAS